MATVKREHRPHRLVWNREEDRYEILHVDGTMVAEFHVTENQPETRGQEMLARLNNGDLY